MDVLQTPQKYLKNPKPVPPFLFPIGTAILIPAMLEILKSTLFPLLPHPLHQSLDPTCPISPVALHFHLSISGIAMPFQYAATFT